jgi:hypothetical protein
MNTVRNVPTPRLKNVLRGGKYRNTVWKSNERFLKSSERRKQFIKRTTINVEED